MPKTQAASNVLPLVGTVLLVVPSYFTARWIRVVSGTDSHEARVAEFGSVFPHMLQDPLASTLFALGCSAAGAAVGAVGLVRLSGLRRRLCAAMLGVGGLLASWLVWTLL